MDGFKSKFRWLFSGHYKMERFGITFVALVLCMGILMGTIVKHKIAMDHIALGNNVIYTTDFGMSLSGNRLSVENIFSNSSQTKAFVLLKFADMSNVITDASHYSLFLTATDMNLRQQTPLCNPNVTIYMFGTTGYMGLYFVDVAGFQSQILDCVIRCDAVAGAVLENIPVYEDASFSQFDQGRLYFNPGGADFVTADFLDNNKMTVADIYDIAVTQSQETAIKADLSQNLEDMQVVLKQIDEYSKRVQDSGIIVPMAPQQIRGDQVVTTNEGNLALVTDYVLLGGYDFDWYHGNIKAGYAASAIPDGQSIPRYVAQQRKAFSQERFVTDNLRWLQADGTDFFANQDVVQSAAYEAISANISNLMSAWREYYDLKRFYQVTNPERLLILESDTNVLSTNYTVNSNLDNITVYG